jgi:hypothetical protein
MGDSRTLFVLETTLIVLMLIGFAMIAQQWSFGLYRVGMLTVIFATIANIGVGNVPRSSRGWRAFRNFCILMAVVAVVVLLGIVLVPYLALLGR